MLPVKEEETKRDRQKVVGEAEQNSAMVSEVDLEVGGSNAINIGRRLSSGSSSSGTSPLRSGQSTPHCHDDSLEQIDTSGVSRRKLLIACVLCVSFMSAEIAGGLLSNSLAIMTDALHLLTDLVGFGISVAAITLARRPATRQMTFGWYRAEVLGALVSVLLVWGITAILVFMAIERVISNDYTIEPQIMLITSSLGVGINLIMGIQLQHGGHGHSHGLGGGHGHSHGGNRNDDSGHGHGHGHSHAPHATQSASSSKRPSISNSIRARANSDNSLQCYGTIEHCSPSKGNPEGYGHSHIEPTAVTVVGAIGTPNKAESLVGSVDVTGEVIREDDENRLLESSRLKTFSVTGDEENADHHLPARSSVTEEAPEQQTDMNVRAAVIHILGDLGQSVGVMIAALIIYFQPDYKIADPICTFIFSIVVLFTTITIMRDVFHILMEGTPRHVDYEKMTQDLLQVDGVRSVHNLRIWALTVSKVAASAHIGFSEKQSTQNMSYDDVLQRCRKVLQKKHGVADLTLQVEQHTSAMDNCGKCQPPPGKSKRYQKNI